MRIRLIASLALAALCQPAQASDSAGEVDFEAARANTKEIAHEVSVDVREPGVATFTVTRTFVARSPADPINIHRVFEIPTGVVTAFALRTDGRWREGVLRRDNPARSEKGTPGVSLAGEPWASLELQTGVQPEFETTAFRAVGPVQVRYTVWAKGEPTKSGHSWAYCARKEELTDAGAPVKMLPAAPDTPVEIRARSDFPSCIEIVSKEPPRAKLSARYGVYRLGPRAWSWRVELVAPESVGSGMALPEQAPIVFVLDASRSQQRHGGLAAQLEIVEALLANAQKAEVELVRVDRNAHRVFGRFVPAGEFARSLPAGFAQGPLENGSFLDRGAAIATELLKGEGGPGRVVLFTDGQLRSGFNRADVTATLRRAPRGTTVHLVYPYRGRTKGASVEHRTGEPLDEIAVALGGAAYGVSVGVDPVIGPRSLTEGVRRLLSPDQIESLALSRAGGREPPEWPDFESWRRGDRGVRGELRGGEEASWSGLSEKPPPPLLRLTGWVWGKKLEFRLKPDPVMQRQLPRLVTSDLLLMTCDGSPRHRETAMRDGFLAPGVVFWIGGGGPVEMFRWASLPYDPCIGGFSGGGGIAEAVTRDDLPPEIDFVARGCGLAPGGVRAKIETQENEILDVAVVGGDAAQRGCATTALWGVRLPDKFNDAKYGRQSYDVLLSPSAGGAGGWSGGGEAGGAAGGDSGRRQR